ncbi:MAG: hypothetical protein QOC64_1441 [Solirubrobacteraceae bacterium]|jgi:hypothetical protein|nr:hypothetical protein [Solirubrobacteraceae bacterium]
MRLLLTVFVAAAAAAVLTACGGQETEQRNAYADAVNRAQSDFAQSFKSLSDRISSTTTPNQGRRTLQGFEDAVDDVVVDLRAIDAPADVQPLHRRLIGEMSGYGREIRKAKRAFASSAPQRILDAQQALVRATTRISTRINRTIAAINRELQT